MNTHTPPSFSHGTTSNINLSDLIARYDPENSTEIQWIETKYGWGAGRLEPFVIYKTLTARIVNNITGLP